MRVNDPEIGKLIGERVRMLRQMAGLSQSVLAERAQIHRPNISRLESGRREPSLSILARVAPALGVTVSALLVDIESVQ